MKTQKPNINPNKFFSYLKTTNSATLATKQNLWHNTLDKHIKYKRLAYSLAFGIWKILTDTRNRINACAMAWAVLICASGLW